MKDLIAAAATLVFMVSTFGAMIHCAMVVCGGGSVLWLSAWLAPIGIASIFMALTDAPAPIWEKTHG